MVEVKAANTIEAWRAAAAAIADSAIQNAHILHVLEAAIAQGSSKLPILTAHENSTVVGIATTTPMTLIYAKSPEATDALADGIAHRTDSLRLVIANSETARAAYERISTMRPSIKPTGDVEHKILSLGADKAAPVDIDQRRRGVEQLHVRLAIPDDAVMIARCVGELVRTELGYDPRERPAYLPTIHAQITRGQFFVAEATAASMPVAFCSVSIRNAQTIRVDNFVVPPELRGRGYGKAATLAFSNCFLRRSPTVSILVRVHNAIARALYAKTGFKECGELRYLYFAAFDRLPKS